MQARTNETQPSHASKPPSASEPSLGGAAAAKRVKFQLPLHRAMLAAHGESDEEEESAVRAAKRLRAANGGAAKSKLTDLLPKPKNDPSQALGAGTTARGRCGKGCMGRGNEHGTGC